MLYTYMDKNSWIHTLTRLIGFITLTDLLDTYMDKNSWIHTLTRTYWFDAWTDLLDTYMDKNSRIHTLARLIGFVHGQTCWIFTWTIILGYTD